MNNLVDSTLTTTLIEEELTAIFNILQNWSELSEDPTSDQVSVHAGLGSIVALFLDAYVIKNDLLEKGKTRDYINKTVEALTNADVVYSSFCGGLSGYGYLLRHLRSLNSPNLYHQEFDSYLSEIDEVVIDTLADELTGNNLDMLHGSIGIGIYLIKAKKYKAVEDIIQKLDAEAVRKGGMIYWKHFDRFHSKEDVYDLGLAHGNAGKLYFLGACLQHNIMPEKCKELITGGLKFYFNNRQEPKGEIVSFFPPTLSAKEFDQVGGNYKNRFSRVAWCYGDLGIFHTFLLLANTLNDRDLYEKSIEALSQVALRRTKAESGCNGNGFCHGSAGNSIIFRNIYNLTGVQLFEETADYWLEQSFASKDFDLAPEKSILGYQFLVSEKLGLGRNFTLLEGLASVAGACLMAISGKKGLPLIEEIMFLKY